MGRNAYIERLKHRRWAAQFPYPRIFGYVEQWDDRKGEGVIIDQEKTQRYFVIRDEIGKAWHNHKTLEILNVVEFFATDEVDEVMGLPLARNVTGMFGRPVKESQHYRDDMLAFGNFPKRWADNVEDYRYITSTYYTKIAARKPGSPWGKEKFKQGRGPIGFKGKGPLTKKVGVWDLPQFPTLKNPTPKPQD